MSRLVWRDALEVQVAASEDLWDYDNFTRSCQATLGNRVEQLLDGPRRPFAAWLRLSDDTNVPLVSMDVDVEPAFMADGVVELFSIKATTMQLLGRPPYVGDEFRVAFSPVAGSLSYCVPGASGRAS